MLSERVMLRSRPPTPISIPTGGTPAPPGPLLPPLVAMFRHPVILTSLPTFVLLLLASMVRAVVIPTPSSTVLALVGRVVGVLARVAGVVPRRPPVVVLLVLEHTERRRGVVEV